MISFSLNCLEAVQLKHAMQTVQQFRDTTGENATDSVMIIDTSDLIIPTFARPPLFDHDFVTVSLARSY